MSNKARQDGGWKGPSKRLAERAPAEGLLSDPAFRRLLHDGSLKFCRRCCEKRPDVKQVKLPLHAAIERGIDPTFASEYAYALCAPCRGAADCDAWIARNLGFIAKGASLPFVSKSFVIAAEGDGDRDDSPSPSREPEK